MARVGPTRGHARALLCGGAPSSCMSFSGVATFIADYQSLRVLPCPPPPLVAAIVQCSTFERLPGYPVFGRGLVPSGLR